MCMIGLTAMSCSRQPAALPVPVQPCKPCTPATPRCCWRTAPACSTSMERTRRCRSGHRPASRWRMPTLPLWQQQQVSRCRAALHVVGLLCWILHVLVMGCSPLWVLSCRRCQASRKGPGACAAPTSSTSAGRPARRQASGSCATAAAAASQGHPGCSSARRPCPAGSAAGCHQGGRAAEEGGASGGEAGGGSAGGRTVCAQPR